MKITVLEVEAAFAASKMEPGDKQIFQDNGDIAWYDRVMKDGAKLLKSHKLIHSSASTAASIPVQELKDRGVPEDAIMLHEEGFIATSPRYVAYSLVPR